MGLGPLPGLKTQNTLPPVMAQRKGQFELIPDFLQQNTMKKDMMNIEATDLMQEALNKQDELNKNSGMSMSELLKQKRLQAEKKVEEAKEGEVSQQDKNERAARLRAQRDLLKKKKEQERQEELNDFNEKCQTKNDLFNELKKMDEGTKDKAPDISKVGADKRMEMLRKLRKDEQDEKKEAQKDAFERRKTEIEAKDKKKQQEINFDDGEDWLKGI